jgi:hypothetical protein
MDTKELCEYWLPVGWTWQSKDVSHRNFALRDLFMSDMENPRETWRREVRTPEKCEGERTS